MVLVDPRSSPDDLLELGHRIDSLVQDNQFAGPRINTGGQQFAGCRNDRIRFVRVDEVTELILAFAVVPGDANNLAGSSFERGTNTLPLRFSC